MKNMGEKMREKTEDTNLKNYKQKTEVLIDMMNTAADSQVSDTISD